MCLRQGGVEGVGNGWVLEVRASSMIPYSEYWWVSNSSHHKDVPEYPMVTSVETGLTSREVGIAMYSGPTESVMFQRAGSLPTYLPTYLPTVVNGCSTSTSSPSSTVALQVRPSGKRLLSTLKDPVSW